MSHLPSTLGFLALAVLLGGCRGGPEAAREDLAEMGLEVDAATFLAVIARSDLKAVELFLAAGIDPNGWHVEQRELPLTVASGEAEAAVVEILLNNGADPGLDASILAVAAARGRAPVVDLLLAAGADPDAADELGRTALVHAAETGQAEVARRLLAAGAQVDVEGGKYPGMTPLVYAVQDGDAELVEILLAAGADPDVRSGKYQLTPLMLAAWSGKRAIVEQLLAAGADPEIENYRGETAVKLARRGKDPAVARLLSEVSTGG